MLPHECWLCQLMSSWKVKLLKNPIIVIFRMNFKSRTPSRLYFNTYHTHVFSQIFSTKIILIFIVHWNPSFQLEHSHFICTCICTCKVCLVWAWDVISIRWIVLTFQLEILLTVIVVPIFTHFNTFCILVYFK